MRKDNICPIFPKKFAPVFVDFFQNNAWEAKTTEFIKRRCEQHFVIFIRIKLFFAKS
jgi:hypothetical protein